MYLLLLHCENRTCCSLAVWGIKYWLWKPERREILIHYHQRRSPILVFLIYTSSHLSISHNTLAISTSHSCLSISSFIGFLRVSLRISGWPWTYFTAVVSLSLGRCRQTPIHPRQDTEDRPKKQFHSKPTSVNQWVYQSYLQKSGRDITHKSITERSLTGAGDSRAVTSLRSQLSTVITHKKAVSLKFAESSVESPVLSTVTVYVALGVALWIL